MKLVKSIIVITFMFSGINSFSQQQSKSVDANGNTYTSFSNDPSSSRWYVLDNGLTVILAKNSQKPRVQTLIATKAGSSSDPADNTGLAHYLEHMLFKGTDRYGSLDFSKEKIYLDQIDNLYEQYNKTTDVEKRKKIYKKIDQVSGEAAKFAIANEYDRMLQGIGAKGTNAFTSFERTVYVNDIPANQINNWLTIEAERFRNPILRLFHTELEAVYEEKNRGLDNDGRQVYEKLFENMFPNHNYGKQTTIGTIEHLKNPSLTKIRNYYRTYYVPNNMAVIMVGDIDVDATFEEVKRKFEYMEAKDVPKQIFDNETPLIETKKITVIGPSAESLMIGYRVPNALSKDADLVKLVDLILANSKAGLIDLNLVKAQKCVQAYCSPSLLKERGMHMFAGKPLSGQSLEELEQLFYDQINLLKQGDFDMNLVKSIVLNQKVDDIKKYDSYASTAYSLMDAFVMGNNWSDNLASLDKKLTYSKEDIISFANKYYTDGHVVVYKKKGEPEDRGKVDKPEITKVEVNRGKSSAFVDNILKIKPVNIKPQYLDYKNDIEFSSYGEGIPIWKVKEGDEQLFSLYYVLDIGSFHDQKLAMAVEYLKYLGTDTYRAEDISKEFYKLACNYGVSTNKEQSYVYLTGLASSFDKALALFEDLLANANPDKARLDQLIARKLKGRADAKLNKNKIMSHLRSYALFGDKNPSNYVLSNEQLHSITAEELVNYIHNLGSYNHKIWYSGPLSTNDLKSTLDKYHNIPNSFLPTPKLKEFKMLDTDQPKTFFADYDMVQTEVMWLKKSNELDIDEAAKIAVFNEYFGGGMSSIVFQEIRESKALAYSTYSYYASASKLGDNNMVMAYIGTQADKLEEGVAAMQTLLKELPIDEKKFLNGKNALRQNLETSRILKTAILFNYDKALKLNLEEDSRKLMSEKLDDITMDDIVNFHKEKISGTYVYALLGSEENIDLEKIESLMDVKTVTLEELFGY